MKRPLTRWRRMLVLVFAASLPAASPAAEDYPPVLAEKPLSFPADYGAHPQFRTEWWYVTGWLANERGQEMGFQLTFFRTRPQLDERNPSRFAPRQLLFAHAALSDPRMGRLQAGQRAARAGFGLAEARVGNTEVHIDDWSLKRQADGRYVARVVAETFSYDLVLSPTQPIMAQGEGGFSRKGQRPLEASYYYSEPQLAVRGTLRREHGKEQVQGKAWLDHEWSSAYLAREAVGWDWVGINLDDGGALMAFRMRDARGATVFAAANIRRQGVNRHYTGAAVNFTPQRRWRSPRTGAQYPIWQRIEVQQLAFDIVPLLEDQELDSRQSTGTVYWEGAITARQGGKEIGRGYLELVGYFAPLKM